MFLHNYSSELQQQGHMVFEICLYFTLLWVKGYNSYIYFGAVEHAVAVAS